MKVLLTCLITLLVISGCKKEKSVTTGFQIEISKLPETAILTLSVKDNSLGAELLSPIKVKNGIYNIPNAVPGEHLTVYSTFDKPLDSDITLKFDYNGNNIGVESFFKTNTSFVVIPK